MQLVPTIANALWMAACVPAHARFQHALRDPEAAQRSRLRAYLERNAGTAFGRKHDFGALDSYEAFARRVPMGDYESFAPWLDRIREGQRHVLTSEPVTHLVPTSGSTQARKLIPFTSTLQREFQGAISPWLVDLVRRHPAMLCGPAYWSVSPALGAPQTEPSAIPIGFESDAAYLGGTRQRLVESVLAVPAPVQRAGSLDGFRYATLLALLRARELRLISVWHPSYLTLLLDALPKFWDDLLRDVERGSCHVADEFAAADRAGLTARPRPDRASELRRCDPEQPASLWPKLTVISCWSAGAAATGRQELGRRFPRTLIQPKGLLATEAFVTLPFAGRHPLAVASHFFEFQDEHGRIHLPHNLRDHAEYEVVVTTGGGLWRYRLGDRVRVTGWVERTPALEFRGRTGGLVDLCGEKLSESFVTNCLADLFRHAERAPRFVMLAPESAGASCRYTLYLESGDAAARAAELAMRLDERLRRNPHYALCRDLEQLQSPGIFMIERDGYETFVRRMAAAGARVGDVKPVGLSLLNDWSKTFTGTLMIAGKLAVQ